MAWARREAAWAFAGALLLAALTARRDIQPNDEGLMLQAAARIAHGQVPYGDFWWFYPPGQPYLLGALHAVFGPSLIAWRVVRVLADAAVSALAYALARRGGASPGPAVAAWGVAALAMAYPSGPHPFPIALALALGAVLLFEARPALAGVLVGVAAAWRLEFAAWAGLGIVLALMLDGRRREALRAAGLAVAVGVALVLPVALAAGLSPTWRLLVRYPLLDFRTYQSLPFPWPWDYEGGSLESLLLFGLPTALVLGLVAALVLARGRLRRREPVVVAATVLALGMLTYLLVRADLFHTAPLSVLVGLLAAWGWTARPRAVAVLAAGVLAFALVEGVDRQALLFREDVAPLGLPVADGVRADRQDGAALAAAVRDVQRRVPVGRPIYVTGLRNDLVTAGAPLFYVLAGRENPTRYDIAAPGVITSAPVQREIVGALRRTRTPVVVRWRSPTTAAREPNRAGRSSGVRILDSFLSASYRPVARHGDWELLSRRR